MAFDGDTTDSIGSNDATISGSVSLTADKLGVASQAYDFTGGYMNWSNSNVLIDDDMKDHFSISFWMNADTINTTQYPDRMLAIYSTTSSSAILFGTRNYLAAGNEIYIFWRDTGGTGTGTVVLNPINTSQWYHVCVTWDGTNRKVYANGIEKIADTPAGLTVISAHTASIGAARNGTSPFDGKLDNVLIFDRVLSFGEVNELYNAYDYSFLDTGTQTITIPDGNVFETSRLFLGYTPSQYLTSFGTIVDGGAATYEISGNDGVNWQTLIQDSTTSFTVADTEGVRMKITADGDDVTLTNTLKATGEYDAPAIQTKMIE